MTKKQHIIQAFKSLDFAALRALLDDDRAYMDVPKELFLSKLEQELAPAIKEGLDVFEHVVEGVCGTCNKGCKAYSFTKKDIVSLNLFFEEENGKVIDIYLCDNINVESQNDACYDLSFSFYEEEKVGFTEDFTYLNKLQKIQTAIDDFHFILDAGIPQITDLLYWYQKYALLAEELNLEDPFISKNYKAYQEIDRIYTHTSFLVSFYKQNKHSHEALKEYSNLDPDNETEMRYWLQTHESHSLYNCFTKTKHWKKTGLVKITIKSLVFKVDCSECLDSLLFAELYSKLYKDLIVPGI